jgi:phosphoribosyl 1,2-cyclic phosphodiesterase
MQRKASIIASGSEGNCVYINTGNHELLIDVGMNIKYISSKLEELNTSLDNIDYIFITHGHSDHIASLDKIIKNYNPMIFIDEKCMNEIKILENYNNINLDDSFKFDDFEMTSYRTSHDAKGSRGYIFNLGDESIVYTTDTGYINHKHFKKLENHTYYIFESNHDIEMLMHGSYPPWLKARVRSDEGHLSNQQAGFYLSKIIGDNTKEVILAHLSKENNTHELAIETVLNTLKENNIEFNNIITAKQNERVDIF